MGFKSGWLTVGMWEGAPVRLHWTIPVAAFFFGRFEIQPAFWFGFFLLVMIHEFGHALLVKRFKLTVRSIDVNGLGGLCLWVGNTTPFRRSLIAWGGVSAQTLVLVGTYATVAVTGPPTDEFTTQLFRVFTHTNLWLMGLNLLPIAPLDGEEAWKVPGMLWESFQTWRAKRSEVSRAKKDQAQRRKAAKDDLVRLAEADDVDAADPVADQVAQVLQAATQAANEGDRPKSATKKAD